MDLRAKWHGVETRWWLLGGTVVGIGGLVLVKKWRAAKATNAASMSSVPTAPTGLTNPAFNAPLPGGGGVGGGSGFPLPPMPDFGGSNDPLPTAEPVASEPAPVPVASSWPTLPNMPAPPPPYVAPGTTYTNHGLPATTFTPSPAMPAGTAANPTASGTWTTPPPTAPATSGQKVYKRGIGWVDA